MKILAEHIGHKSTRRSLGAPCAIGLLLALGGCGSLHLEPDSTVAPSASMDRSWNAPESVQITDANALGTPKLARMGASANLRTEMNAQQYDLQELVELALQTNPETRTAWYAAQAANAQLGQSMANDYPKIMADGEGGYLKLPIQFPGQTLVVRNEAFLPQIKVSYDLLDFGRTRSAECGAREQLIAANFAFNRAIQDVVFSVEKAYFVLAASNASVGAAESNLKLARTSSDAVLERHQMGLATRPQILLAKQVEAQAVFDLENAKSMLHDAKSALYETIGLAPDVDLSVPSVDQQIVPSSLGDDIEKLMNDAVKNRPDIAAQVAAVAQATQASSGRSQNFIRLWK